MAEYKNFIKMTIIIIREKIEFIAKTLSMIKDILAQRKKNPLLKDYLLFSAEKKAEEIVESAVSINQEILKTYFDYLSGSYYDSFMDLKNLKAFSEKELRGLAATAGFRNRLAHEYLNLNEEITIKSIENLLKIYPVYLRKIKQFTDKKR